MNLNIEVINKHQLLIDPKAMDAFHMMSEFDYFFKSFEYNLQKQISIPTFELPIAYRNGKNYNVFANWYAMQPHVANSNDSLMVLVCDQKPRNIPLISWLYVFYTHSRMMCRKSLIGNFHAAVELCPQDVISLLIPGAKENNKANLAFFNRLLQGETRQTIRNGINTRI